MNLRVGLMSMCCLTSIIFFGGQAPAHASSLPKASITSSVGASIAQFIGALPLWRAMLGHDLITKQQAQGLFGKKYSPNDDTYEALCHGRWSLLDKQLSDYSPADYPTVDKSSVTLYTYQGTEKSAALRYAYLNDDPECVSGRVQYFGQRLTIIANIFKGNGNAIIRDENIPAYPWFEYKENDPDRWGVPGRVS